MLKTVPKIAAIHDMSGVGRCSLTVALPILSAMGSQACPMPTAVLSSHSGGYVGFSFVDLTDKLPEYIQHWERLDLDFDCIYSGFLGSPAQIQILKAFIATFSLRKKPLVVVDPVMGDEGYLYSTYTDEMQVQMRELIKSADLITPNMTEVSYLLEEPYCETLGSVEEAKLLAKRLAQRGPQYVVITGVVLSDTSRLNVAYDRSKDAYTVVSYKQVPVHYPGTGDVFTSVLVGGMMQGRNLHESLQIATEYVSETVALTYVAKTPEREGVHFEKTMATLVSTQNKE